MLTKEELIALADLWSKITIAIENHALEHFEKRLREEGHDPEEVSFQVEGVDVKGTVLLELLSNEDGAVLDGSGYSLPYEEIAYLLRY